MFQPHVESKLGIVIDADSPTRSHDVLLHAEAMTLQEFLDAEATLPPGSVRPAPLQEVLKTCAPRPNNNRP